MKRLTVSLLLSIVFIYACSFPTGNNDPLTAGESANSIAVVDAVVGAQAVEPLSVIYFYQNDNRWGNEKLGTSSSLLKDYGCAVTSLAMVYAYAGGVISDGKIKGMDPPLLNAVLGGKANSIAWDSKDVCPSGLGTLERDDFTIYSTTMNYLSTKDPAHLSKIINELTAGRPVIARVKSSSQDKHFVVITGSTGDNFTINDPDATNHSSTLFGGTRPYTITGIRTFCPTHPTVMIDEAYTRSAATISGSGIQVPNECKTTGRLGYGTHLYYSTTLASGTATVSASWRATLPATGVWNLYVWVPRAYASTTGASYEIYTGTYGGANTTKITIQQRPYFDEWVKVGSGFSYIAGTAVYVKLNNVTGTAGDVIAYDAIKWSL
jgi:hypothetical protein